MGCERNFLQLSVTVGLPQTQLAGKVGSWELAVVVAGIREEVSQQGSSGISILGVLDSISSEADELWSLARTS